MQRSGANVEAIAARWIECALASYPAGTQATASVVRDPFRDPAGHTIRTSLTTLARELFGAMDEKAIAQALDEVVRLRAVQGFRPSEALGFLLELRQLAAAAADNRPADLDRRIDRLALMAFDLYMACRDRVAELREKELRVRLQYAAASRIEP